MNTPKTLNEIRYHQSSTPLGKKQSEDQFTQQEGYMRKHSILKKLMIAQRKKFLMKKEQADYNKLKKKLNDASISNFSQASEYIKFNEIKKNSNDNQNENVK
jgi:hypothetical protein